MGAEDRRVLIREEKADMEDRMQGPTGVKVDEDMEDREKVRFLYLFYILHLFLTLARTIIKWLDAEPLPCYF